LRRQSRTNSQRGSSRSDCAQGARVGTETRAYAGRWCFTIWHSIFVWEPRPWAHAATYRANCHEATRSALFRDARLLAPGLARQDGNGSERAGTETAVLDGIAGEAGCKPAERSLGRLRPDPPRARPAGLTSRSEVLAQSSQGPNVPRALTHAPFADGRQPQATFRPARSSLPATGTLCDSPSFFVRVRQINLRCISPPRRVAKGVINSR
jgi:hypothetical protein